MARAKVAASITDPRQQMRADIDRLRGEIEDLKQELQWTRNSPLPRDEVRDLIAGWIDGQAGKFESERLVSSAIQNHAVNDDALAMVGRLNGNSVAGVLTGSASTDLGPLLCWLIGDVLRGRLLDKLADVHWEPGPPRSERPKLISDLEKQLRELETAEERLIVEAEAVGLEIRRRDDADPKIILNYEE